MDILSKDARADERQGSEKKWQDQSHEGRVPAEEMSWEMSDLGEFGV